MQDKLESENVVVGYSYIKSNDSPVRFLKYPFCSFVNIHLEDIEHQIRSTKKQNHEGDSNTRNNESYCSVVKSRKQSPFGPYLGKDTLDLPRINCLFCSFNDKIEFDLSLHMLKEHKHKLLQIPISSQDRKQTKALSGDLFTRFEPAIEFRLDVAVELAKIENQNLGVKHAISQIQKRVSRRQEKKEITEDSSID